MINNIDNRQHSDRQNRRTVQNRHRECSDDAAQSNKSGTSGDDEKSHRIGEQKHRSKTAEADVGRHRESSIQNSNRQQQQRSNRFLFLFVGFV